jgi:hypothetical protein
MRKIINQLTGRSVRVGDKFSMPGGLLVEIVGFASRHAVLRAQDGNTDNVEWPVPLDALQLQWKEEKEPSRLMTDDDWIHATNNARETGGHFMGYLARAYQHADGSNRPPIKAAYHAHFFRFLSEDRRKYLQELAQQGLE